MSGRDKFVEVADGDVKALIRNPKVNDTEREVVKRLVEEVAKWQSAAPIGLDFVMERLARMVLTVDAACTLVGGDMDQQRFAAVAEMNAYLRKPPVIANVARNQAKRRKLCSGKKDAELSGAYDSRTLALISEDWPAWLEEGELGGFMQSIIALARAYGESLEKFANDGTEPQKVHFMASFDLRHKLGKVPKEMIEALELLGKEGALAA